MTTKPDLSALRYAIVSGALSPSLARILSDGERSDSNLRAVAGDQYERLLEVVSIRWNHAYGLSINSTRPMPTRSQIIDGVISDWARGDEL
jgi:hypothetical protein